MNSIELLEYYQKKSGYIQVNEEETKEALQKILNDFSPYYPPERLESIKEIFIKEFQYYNKNIPTKYQNPHMYFILDDLFNKIDKAAHNLPDHSDMIFPDKITYGTVHINLFTASARITNVLDDYLIMVSDCMFMFANLLAKSIGMLISNNARKDERGWLAFNVSKDNISNALYNNFDAIIRFTDLILAYIVTGEAASAKQYTPVGNLEFITLLIRESYELFVVGHEYSHIMRGHLKKKCDSKNMATEELKIADEIIEIITRDWEQEHEADLFSAILTINAMEGYDFATSYMGVDICLITLIILERIKTLFDNGDSKKIPSHPPAELRREFIFNVLSENDESIKDIYDNNTYIVDSLWDRCMYVIVKMNQFFEDKFKVKITNVNYGITQNLLYKFGKIFLSAYNEEHPLGS